VALTTAASQDWGTRISFSSLDRAAHNVWKVGKVIGNGLSGTRTELGCQSSEGMLWTAIEECAVIRPEPSMAHRKR
jgi:hypothetical protein